MASRFLLGLGFCEWFGCGFNNLNILWKTLTKFSQHPVIKKIPYLSDFINRVINMRRGEYPPMKTKTKKYLQEYFAPYNKELEKFTGLDLSMWEK